MSELKFEVETNEETEIFPGYTSVEHFTKDGFKVLMEAIRHSNALPTGRDWSFYSISDSFTQIINEEGNNVLTLMNQIMGYNEIDSNIKNKILDEKTELVIEANDMILEKVANNIDEMNGIRKSLPEPVIIQTVSAELPINGSWNRSNAITINPASPQTLGKNCIKLITAKNIVRPQKFFKDKIDNSNKYPWCPRITEKPNSLKPLAIFLEESENGEEYSHPYEFELDRFSPTPEQLIEEIPEFPKKVSQTPLIEIDEPEQLNDLVESLRSCKEFAVDLEHHSYRSFMGITCLLQISTKDSDYLIDTLALRDKLCILNEVFTNNKIVKIFHGADKDIEWLQRDLSIYVVNMFDTHQAAKVLQYSGLSLAFLMKKFCNILPNKEFQLVDWRIRPLPEEFKTYAREDTHYLIYLYKVLKKELLLKGNKTDNLLKSVIERSTELCKKRYFKPILRDDSHLEIYRKCKKMFDNRQLYALKELYAWRDDLARQEDESLAYVLPNHMLLQISETLPREMQGILACCNPIPPLVRSHLLELHQIILKAREQPLEKAILKEDTTGRGVLKKVSKVNVDSSLHCPHDLSKTSEFRDDLPTLLNVNELKVENKNVVDLVLSSEKLCSYSIFDDECDEDSFNERKRFKQLRGFAYFSPYERYKLVKPFAVEEEKVEQAREEEMSKEKEKEAVEDTAKDSRTDEDRIASIRDHFMELSKKFNDELEAKKQEAEKQKPLIEMEGARKRKRDYGNEEINCYPKFEIENNFHTTVPHIKTSPSKFNNRNKRGKKRKYNEISFVDDNHEQQNSFNLQQSIKRKKKNQQQQQQRQQKQNLHKQNQQEQNQQNENQQKQRKRKNKNQFSHQQSQQKHLSHKQQEHMIRKQSQNIHKQGKSQENANFVPYDYSSVDFRQFQGGAGSVMGATKIKSNFKAKNRKKMDKKGSKSSIFKNINKDRGKEMQRTVNS